jgi:hypothetical protein
MARCAAPSPSSNDLVGRMIDAALALDDHSWQALMLVGASSSP